MKEILTERFILRKVERADEDEIFEILSDEQTIENLNMNIHKTKEDTKKLIEEYLEENKVGTKYPYAILDKQTKSLIGVFLIKLDLYDEDCFEFTIYINKKYWGKGIYTEVLPYMTEFAFEKIKTGNFRGFVMEKNNASSRVLEKCNFKLEKIFNVPNIEDKIKSYLMTKDDFYKMKNNEN